MNSDSHIHVLLMKLYNMMERIIIGAKTATDNTDVTISIL